MHNELNTCCQPCLKLQKHISLTLKKEQDLYHIMKGLMAWKLFIPFVLTMAN